MFKLRPYSSSFLALLVALTAGTSVRTMAQSKPEKSPILVDSALSNFMKRQEMAGADVNLGYLKVKKRTISGAVSIVPASSFNELPKLSIDALLQGQAAGVRVVNSSGAAGAGALVNIRGISTFNAGTMPLFIVDGVPVKAARIVNPLALNSDNNPLADINPGDIETVTVLKDAQSTAAYGMRGANGVILIDTYGGTQGKTLLDFSGFSGVISAPKSLSVLNAQQYRSFILEKEQARGQTPAQINNGVGRYLLLSTPANQVERYNNDTDWQDLVTRGSLYNDYHFNLRGGDAVTKYSLNLGYANQSGAVENTGFSRFSTRFNLDYKVGRKLSFLNSIYYAQTNRRTNDGGSAFLTNPLFLASVKSPTLAALQQSVDGTNLREPDSADYAGNSNPYSVIERMRNLTASNRVSGRVIGQYVFSPNLNLRIGLFADYSRLNERRFRPSAGFARVENVLRESSEQNTLEMMAMNENTLNYSKTSKSGDHQISAMLGNALQTTTRDSKFGVFINATSDQLSIVNTGNQRFIDTLTSDSPTWNLLSFFSNAQYTYKGKYTVAASVRADGSSRFEKGNRWGYFPGVSAGWLISSEPFLMDSRAIGELKLRASYGITGNQEVGYFNSFNALVPAPYFNYPGTRLGRLGNKNFTWEETTQFDAGLDVGLFNGRIALSTDVYSKRTTNLYNRIALPTISGFQSYPVSEGELKNTGFELGLSAKILTGKMGWQSSFNGAYNKNEIVSFPSLLEKVVSYGDFSGAVQVGSSVGAFYGFNAIGVYANSSDLKPKNGAADAVPFQGGDIMFEDVDKNGIIDNGDRKFLGNSSPDFFGGFSNTFTYGKFDLNVFLDFSVGNEVYNGQRAYLEAMSGYNNQSAKVLNRWMKEGDVSEMPRALHGDAVGNNRFSSRWIEDGSYLRFKSVSLGYTVATEKFLKGVFKSARIVLTGQNLHTFSNYSGESPEVANVNNPILYGQNYGSLPQLKSFLLGIKLGL
ncbi:SusC/RagA family TonB-linked outer membrane protein [Paradesertivirga mongoliensis]|uniref:SusC/RagA family TonB-linked outer membrane protein n=1 Tax=Paradesertivirga mongoliensis TaxID=2100740 RepID=A0ABW4ZKU7_9SPHI|nr:SusC/RagA family TonB-linked outer membrane protein [Pedobacter mongoliensis]